LDLFTVKVMTLVNMMVLSGAAFMTLRVSRPVNGMRQFGWGVFVFWNGSLLSLIRTLTGGNFIVALSNALMFIGALSIVQGIRAFRGWKPVHGSVIAVAATITAALYLYWMLVHDVFAMRVAVVSPAFGLLAMDAAISMFRAVKARDRAIYWPAACAFALIGADLAIRTIGALTGQYGPSLLAPVPIEIITGVASNVAYTACAFGMLMASNAALRNQYEMLAHFDPLTNLPNRRLFFERLLAAEQRATAEKNGLGLIYMDLDGFKQVNDSLGHQAGDNLLRAIADAMSEVIGPNECLARMGGDEFVALIENNPGRDQVEELAQRLKRAAESCALAGLPLQLSSGIALCPEDARTAQEALRSADLAMYREKRGGSVESPALKLRERSYLPV
jgi:diguanylate cyclase (GGDEF)-like protein